MRRSLLSPANRHPLVVALAFVCIGFVLITGLMQVAHTHAHSPVSHNDCAFCLTAHVSIHPGVADPDFKPTVKPVWRAPESESPSPSYSATFSLYSRPPPELTAAAS